MVPVAKRCLILIAEDDPDDQLFMQDAFKELGNKSELLFFSNGFELLGYLEKMLGTILEENIPCMVFLDLNMPQMDGKEALKQLRSKMHFLSVPVFILTTSASDADRDICYQLGANSFLQKPHGFDLFKQMLAGIYNHWIRFLIPASPAYLQKEMLAAS